MSTALPSTTNAGFPSAVTYDDAVASPWIRRARTVTRKLTGKDLFPEPENLKTFAEDMYVTDTVAERFVAEVYGTLGGEKARAMLDQALSCAVVGSAETVRAGLEDFAARTGADELMVTSQIFDHGARVRSYEILAKVSGQTAG